MTSPLIKVKVLRRVTAKVKAMVRYLSSLVGGTGINVTIANGIATFDLDYTEFGTIAAFDPTAKVVLIYDEGTGSYDLVSLADLINNSASTIQVVTAAGDVNVLPATRVLLMNRTVDESPSNIIMPAAVNKIGDCKVVDWKGNADAFPHTVSLDGAEEFQGGVTEWSIAGAGASIVVDPIPGTGYAV